MSTDYFCCKANNKTYHFIRTDSGRFFDITVCLPDSNGLLRKARLVSDDWVANLYAKSLKGKASKKRRLRKRKAVNLDEISEDIQMEGL